MQTLAAALLIVGLYRLVRIRIRVPSKPPTPAARISSLLGFALALSLTPAAASAATLGLPRPKRQGAAPPWFGAGGSPPPRPLLRASVDDGDRSAAALTPDRRGQHDASSPAEHRSSVHPAIHPGSRRVLPLFPRARAHDDEPDVRRERLLSMRRHPSWKGGHTRIESIDRGSSSENVRSRHVVRNGDTLWEIAALHLDTDDLARIARYWPRIHRANRAVIGSDPHLIRPGQVLLLPPEEKPSISADRHD